MLFFPNCTFKKRTILSRMILTLFFFSLAGCTSFDFRNLFSGYIRYEKDAGGIWIRLPLKEVDHLPVIYLALDKDREPLRFLIDTGAFVSFLSEDHVPENSPKKVLSASFPGGSVQSVRRTIKNDLFIGGIRPFESVEFYSHVFPKELRVDGILGMNAFLGSVVVLDLPDKISLWRSSTSSPAPGFLEENLFPMFLKSGQPSAVLLRPPGTRKESWILDTGAEYSVLDWETIKSDHPTEYLEGKEATVFNFGGGRLSAKIRTLRPFCPVFVKNDSEGIGFCTPELEVFPGGIPPDALHSDHRRGIVGILGRNWMENYRILLDTKRSLIGIVGKESVLRNE
ncbi:aspartyl protease [Leptospira sp. B5-022]|nr:aspartyl protease [Leptospira sp. B5-022]MCR1795072.1 retropepsin-like domain-containing protein [Leptospira sp. id769339]